MGNMKGHPASEKRNVTILVGDVYCLELACLRVPGVATVTFVMSSLSKVQDGLTFWYWLTQVNRYNRCSVLFFVIFNFSLYWCAVWYHVMMMLPD